MADNSKIEWTEASWNPIRARNVKTGAVGWHCVHASTGCVNCYAERFNLKLGTRLPYKPGHLPRDVEVFLDAKTLTQPLRWRRGRKIFPCSMTDLFADFVPDDWVDQMVAVMGLSSFHEFQLLTKRSHRMAQYWNDERARDRVEKIVQTMALPGGSYRGETLFKTISWPPKNIWVGVSVEDQASADERLPELAKIDAYVKWISLEPLIGPVDIGFAPVQWLVIGGESGDRARPCNPNWVRRLIKRGDEIEARVFFKQWGEWMPRKAALKTVEITRDMVVHRFPDNEEMIRVGKTRAGRVIDGALWDQYPQPAIEEGTTP